MAEINFIKYHPDKELDPLFERFLLWSSHILPYNKDEIIKKCEALQRIRNKFRENYTDAKNGLIDVLDKMNKSLMKLITDEQLITIFNKQLKQLSKINKIKYEPIEEFDELYKKNHELYDTLPDYQKERFLFQNLNKEILKYFGLYKSIKERKINNQIDDRLREFNIIKDKDMKRKKEEQEKEDKVMQEIKKAKSEVIIKETPNKEKTNINKFNLLRIKLQQAKDNLPKIDELLKTKDEFLTDNEKAKLNNYKQDIEQAEHYIVEGQTNIQNLLTDELNGHYDSIKNIKTRVDKIETNSDLRKAKKEAKKKSKAPASLSASSASSASSVPASAPSAPEADKDEINEPDEAPKPRTEAPKPIKKSKKELKEEGRNKKIQEAMKTILSNPSKYQKVFYTGKDLKTIKSKSTVNKTGGLQKEFDLKPKEIGKIYDYFQSGTFKFSVPYKDPSQEINAGNKELKTISPDITNDLELRLNRLKSNTFGDNDETVQELQDRLNNLTVNQEKSKEELIDEYNQKTEQIMDDYEGRGILGSIIKGIGSIFGLGSNVLSDKVIKELLQYQNQKDGNKIIDAIIIWELMHNHKNINKSKYTDIIKDFDKKYRPKLYYVRNKFKKYNNSDRFLGGFPFGLLAGLIPGALQGVSSIISAIKGNGCSSLKSTPTTRTRRTNNLKGGKALSLQELNNIKNSIK